MPDILQLDRRRGDPSSLLLLDLDHFKAVNDRHGHLVGDRVLRHVAEILREALRRQDSVIRYGGEEFILLLPGTGLEAARSVAEGLLENLGQRPLRLDDGDLVAIGATIGVAVSPTDGSTWQAVLACADERMYAGKRKGRGRVVAASTATAGPM